MANDQCRSCHAPVRWVLTEPNRKRMPIDPVPAPDGNVWVSGMEGGMFVVSVALSHEGVPSSEPITYVSHFVTCPDRDSWRRR